MVSFAAPVTSTSASSGAGGGGSAEAFRARKQQLLSGGAAAGGSSGGGTGLLMAAFKVGIFVVAPPKTLLAGLVKRPPDLSIKESNAAIGL